MKLSYLFKEWDISWLEEPVASDELEGLRMDKGELIPDTSRFGLGLDLRRVELARYPVR
jgi:hypothetical protein